MRLGWFRLLVFGFAAVFSGQGFAQGLERQAAPFAASGLAVIGPTFNGSDGNTSYIRFPNVGTAASTYTVTVVGSPSGRTYGSTTYTVPAGASPQYSLSQITAQAGAAALSGGDDSYALYLQDSDQYAGYQHVIYNGGNGFFENVSTCATLLTPAAGGVLTNVHTSNLTAYPSQIRIHNYGTQSATYRVTVSDAVTGAAIGTADVSVAANASATYQESYFEQQLHWTPTSSQLHANFSIAPVGTSAFTAVLGSTIFNQQFSAYVSMSEICAINARSITTATGGTASAKFEGTIAGSGQTGTVSVNVLATSASAPAGVERTAVERPRAVSQATGTFKAAGASDVALSGTYDAASGSLTLAGGGLSLAGTASGETLSGTFTNADGTTGGFSALNSTQNAVTNYCGTYTPGDDAGVFNLTVSASGKLSGVTSGTGSGSAVTLAGQVTGSSVSGVSSESVAFSGTIDGAAISGTYISTNGHPGTFSGSSSGCTTPLTSTGGSSGGSTGGAPGTVSVKVVAVGSSGSSVVWTGPHTLDGKTTQETLGTCTGTVGGAGTCNWPADPKSPMTLTAVPGAADTFLGWSGACSGTNTTCIVPFSTAQTVTANFASGQKHTLTVSSTGTGTATVKVNASTNLSCDLGATCTGSYLGSVSVSAFPGVGTTFVGWSGACSGTGSCTIDMNTSDQSVSAQFSGSSGSGGSSGGSGGSSGGSGSTSSAILSLTVTRSGLGADGSITSSPAGIDCSNLCATANRTFNGGTTVTLTATPVSGSTFQGWGGVCTGTGTCTVTMNANQSVTASFSKP
jgi:hypothetical protein